MRKFRNEIPIGMIEFELLLGQINDILHSER